MNEFDYKSFKRCGCSDCLAIIERDVSLKCKNCGVKKRVFDKTLCMPCLDRYK